MATVSDRRLGLAGEDVLGWSIVGLIAGVLAAAWWRLMFLPLGDSHDGRIFGRFGLHVRNFWDDGLAGSGFLTDMAPFPTGTYAHHPPLTNFAQLLVSSVVGQGEWQLRLLGFVSGIATVVALAWLLRTLRFDWAATIAALAATAATPMFWLYTRLGLGFWMSVLLVTFAIRIRRQEGSVRLLVAAGATSALLSWEAAAIAVIVTVWLLRTPAAATAGRALAVAVAVGAFVTAAWTLSATDVSELASHAADRVDATGIGVGDWLQQQWWFYSTLFPKWYLLAVIPGVVAGLTSGPVRRFATVAFLVVGVAFTLGLPEASFIHDYWTKILLVPYTIGIAALVSIVRAPPVRYLLAGVALAAFGLWFAGDQRDWFETAYFDQASDAGTLIERTGPAAAQTTGWVAGEIALPRWMSWYWDVPVEALDASTFAAAGDRDLVLVRWDRLPAWFPAERPPVTAGDGRYALIEVRHVLP